MFDDGVFGPVRVADHQRSGGWSEHEAGLKSTNAAQHYSKAVNGAFVVAKDGPSEKHDSSCTPESRTRLACNGVDVL